MPGWPSTITPTTSRSRPSSGCIDMTKLPEVTKQELLDAIRAGVRDALWEMITNATSTPCGDFYDTVRDGVETAIGNSMPVETQILNAIAAGVKERIAPISRRKRDDL